MGKHLIDKTVYPAMAGALDKCLVVEDDPIILLDLAETLKDFGWRHVLGVSTLEAAKQIIAESEIRFALLDFDLGGSNTVPLAEELAAKGIPAMFLTAYGNSISLPEGLAHMRVLGKPFSPDLLAEAMKHELAKPGPDAGN